MPTIEMSPGMASGISERMLTLGDIAAVYSNIAGSGLLVAGSVGMGTNGMCSYLYLMKGAVPTDFPATVGDRFADVLCAFAVNADSGANGGHFSITNQSVNPCIITTRYVAATQTGEATWFWLLSVRADDSGVAYAPPRLNVAPAQQIIGTVGETGSGADLIIGDTNLTQGKEYRILNLRLQFPTSWTY